MVICAVFGCKKRSGRDLVSFYRIPSVNIRKNRNKELILTRQKLWIASLRRKNMEKTNLKHIRICGLHFISGKPADLFDVQNPDWIPSQRMGYENKIVSKGVTTSLLDRRYASLQEQTKRMRKTLEMKSDNEYLGKDSDCEINEDEESCIPCEVEIHIPCEEEIHIPCEEEIHIPCEVETTEKESVECQTDFTLEDLYNMQKAYMDTITELIGVKDKVSKLCISEETFKNDDEKTRYYTGIQNFSTLMLIFNIIQDDLSQSVTLSKFQQFILTLMRLKLNFHFIDLSYRFCVSKNTVARTFSSCINIMYKKLEKFLVWPNRDELIKEVPQSIIEAFGHKVVIIINSFEIFIEKTQSVQNTSTLKYINTIKFLIGICPKGSIAFISSAWAGNTPDQDIVDSCGILEQLLPNDIVICDKGFEIEDQSELHCEIIKIPERNRKVRKVFSGIDDEEIDNFHGINFSKSMETVIGKLKQYKILQKAIPLSKLSQDNESPALVDKIAKVCCSLINISSVITPID